MADIKEANCGLSEGNFGCHLCNKVYANKDSLRKHVRNVHGESLPDVRNVALSALQFSCSLCSRTFQAQKSVNRHMRQKHADASTTGNNNAADQPLPTGTLSENPSLLVPAPKGRYYIVLKCFQGTYIISTSCHYEVAL